MSGIHDLRSFIATLEAAGQLARIRRPVSRTHELADVAAALERSGGPAPLFSAFAPAADVFDWPIFSSGLAHQTRVALALGCPPEAVTAAMGRALDPAAALPPRVVERAEWQDNVLLGEAIDLRKLPIPIHAQNDGGPFITAGVVISHDPDGGRGNLSYNRLQVLGPRTFGCNINEWRDLRRFLAKAEGHNQPLPVAVAIGVDPALMIAAGCKYDGDEMELAGAIRGQGIAVARGVTVPLLIPAEAEIVIEGRLLPGARADEGPLAEFHGYYGELWHSPVLEVTAVSFRHAPIFQTTIPGWTEHIYLGNVLPREPLLLRFVRHASPNVKALHIPPYGNGFMVIIQLDKRNPGEPRNVALAAFTAHVNIRICLVVDPDVNIYDPADVQWAMVSRVDWGRDVFMVPGAQGHEMDPANDARGIGTKLGIDATFDKGRREYGERVRYHPVDLSQYLGS
ncbi:MAG: UbiD family decarboxylase [Anaerolineales bacterium]|nr:UbiD family decarboxylase [Anaerolineales bacterium]